VVEDRWRLSGQIGKEWKGKTRVWETQITSRRSWKGGPAPRHHDFCRLSSPRKKRPLPQLEKPTSQARSEVDQDDPVFDRRQQLSRKQI